MIWIVDKRSFDRISLVPTIAAINGHCYAGKHSYQYKSLLILLNRRCFLCLGSRLSGHAPRSWILLLAGDWFEVSRSSWFDGAIKVSSKQIGKKKNIFGLFLNHVWICEKLGNHSFKFSNWFQNRAKVSDATYVRELILFGNKVGGVEAHKMGKICQVFVSLWIYINTLVWMWN